MKYKRTYLESIAYHLPSTVMTTEALEDRLAPLYQALRLQRGQLEALTGIRERRWWNIGHRPSHGALEAAKKALKSSSVPPGDIGALIYGGVCRDNFEPATACAVASGLGLSEAVEVCDISNACLGVLNGIISIANRIELGQIRAGMIVSCESSREIIDIMIDEMLEAKSMEMFKLSLATLTGGSGAVALILSDGSYSKARPRLLGGVLHSAPEHHAICRWGDDLRPQPRATQFTETDSAAVLKHGVALGVRTWEAFRRELNWTSDDIHRVICHQVGGSHRDSILKALSIDSEKDFSTFEFLGNMGTVSLPITAAIAAEREFIERGDRVAFLGIGSGLNCMMLGWEW